MFLGFRVYGAYVLLAGFSGSREGAGRGLRVKILNPTQKSGVKAAKTTASQEVLGFRAQGVEVIAIRPHLGGGS